MEKKGKKKKKEKQKKKEIFSPLFCQLFYPNLKIKEIRSKY